MPAPLDPDKAIRTIAASKVILAIGNMHAPRRMDVPGEDLPHVSHYLCDPHEYFGLDVLIVGGKNSAVEAAIRLYRAGARVTMSYRGGEFDPKRVKYWLRPELEWLISKSRIRFLPRTTVRAINSEHVLLEPCASAGEAVKTQADRVLLLTGYMQDASLFRQMGITLEGEEQAPAHNRQTMETNVTGVYVAGTAAGGSQRRARLFIENSHVHVQRIVRDIAGANLPWRLDDEYGALEEA